MCDGIEVEPRQRSNLNNCRAGYHVISSTYGLPSESCLIYSPAAPKWQLQQWLTQLANWPSVIATTGVEMWKFHIHLAQLKDQYFLIECINYATGRDPQPCMGNVPVQNISIHGQLDILMYTANACYNETGWQSSNLFSYETAVNFTISNTLNMFVAVGCDTKALLNATRNSKSFSPGCLSICESISDVIIGPCSGIGFWKVEIPKELKKFSRKSTAVNFTISRHTEHVRGRWLRHQGPP
ncbi:Wall-associated receptor kinase 2 [Morella rubra]|uniref:Wall-associated receptor kinase 2 n=1 Tax=Morella rubra TaxID=262757 RepID=A0A6A1W6K7_9ROSI|nr:Wall-associated receptor kinase 2 [Morella rubra]